MRETVLGAFAHQDMPFELLVEELQPTRSLSHNPLFQVMFLLQSAEPSQRGSTGEPGMRAVHVATTTAKFDLTVSVVETGPAASIGVEFNADLFDIDTVKRLIDRFIALIESAIAEPRTRLSELRLCGAAELRAIEEAMGRPRAGASNRAPRCGVAWSTGRRHSPTRTAVATSEETISYRDLALRAAAARKTKCPRGACALETPSRSGGNCPSTRSSPCWPRAVSARRSSQAHGSRRRSATAPRRRPRRRRRLHSRSPHRGRARALRARPACSAHTHGFRSRAADRRNDRVVLCTGEDGEFAVFETCAVLAAGAELALTTGPVPATPRALATLLRDRRATLVIAPVDTLDRIAREFPWALRDIRAAVAHADTTAQPPVQETLRQKLFVVDGCVEAGGYAFVAPALSAFGASDRSPPA